MTKKEAYKMGIDHAANGLKLTPYDCREIDSVFLAESKKHERPAKKYTNLRSEFNKGWQVKYFEIVK
jgi:hypothetical protein